MELRAGQRNYLNAIMSGFDKTQLIYYEIKTQYTVLQNVVKFSEWIVTYLIQFSMAEHLGNITDVNWI